MLLWRRWDESSKEDRVVVENRGGSIREFGVCAGHGVGLLPTLPDKARGHILAVGYLEAKPSPQEDVDVVVVMVYSCGGTFAFLNGCRGSQEDAVFSVLGGPKPEDFAKMLCRHLDEADEAAAGTNKLVWLT